MSVLPESWDFVVKGDGSDAGEHFRFHWIHSDNLYRIDVELQKFLDPKHLPEILS